MPPGSTVRAVHDGCREQKRERCGQCQFASHRFTLHIRSACGSVIRLPCGFQPLLVEPPRRCPTNPPRGARWTIARPPLRVRNRNGPVSVAGMSSGRMRFTGPPFSPIAGCRTQQPPPCTPATGWRGRSGYRCRALTGTPRARLAAGRWSSGGPSPTRRFARRR